jgi:hypothetical protein
VERDRGRGLTDARFSSSSVLLHFAFGYVEEEASP